MPDNSSPQYSSFQNATGEEYLAAVTIGELTPLNGAIRLVPYDPNWPAEFEQHAGRIREALSERVVLLEHVGSTSVPGLSSKPIIDMVMAVADAADEYSYVTPLEEIGYVLKIREPDWFKHRLLKTAEADVHLHVFSAGCEEIGRMLAFRDWLRTHDDDRLLYERTKRELAQRTWKHTQHYADAKSEVVQAILGRAMQKGQG